ncbi:ATP-binding cassette sub-family D member 3 [Phytophthora ramorum]|uniref:ATP-binding cassette sub-family D member 3 n=1 Tax=Phytophthora ramorum TaxID=164328 RepID=UPI0030B26631|nr:ATP-binding cassette sub-family D member 3 [Phytophthora ramorum]
MKIDLAKATVPLELSGREITRCTSFTARITKLVDILADLNDGNCQRSIAETDDAKPKLSLLWTKEELYYCYNVIQFENAPLATPNREVLDSSLNLKGTTEMNVVVVGPNDCGKSSLFRTLGELWPICGDKLIKPPDHCDECLVNFFEKGYIRHFAEREGGWDIVRDWTVMLSGGEKQQVAMARLFYHKPQFAILGEWILVVSVDVEGRCGSITSLFPR